MSKNAEVLRVRAEEEGARLSVTVAYDGEEGREEEELHVFVVQLEEIPEVGAITDKALKMLLRADSMRAAMSAAMQHLAARDRSVAEMTHRLRQRGFSCGIVEETMRGLIATNLFDERRGALREVEIGLSKLWGDRRILSQLRAKGYGAEGIEAARDRLASEDGAARCRALLQKRRITRPEDPKAASKLVASLMRYGYVAGEIRTALQIELEDE